MRRRLRLRPCIDEMGKIGRSGSMRIWRAESVGGRRKNGFGWVGQRVFARGKRKRTLRRMREYK